MTTQRTLTLLLVATLTTVGVVRAKRFFGDIYAFICDPHFEDMAANGNP